jgi:hypothetical protein
VIDDYMSLRISRPQRGQKRVGLRRSRGRSMTRAQWAHDIDTTERDAIGVWRGGIDGHRSSGAGELRQTMTTRARASPDATMTNTSFGETAGDHDDAAAGAADEGTVARLR